MPFVKLSKPFKCAGYNVKQHRDKHIVTALVLGAMLTVGCSTQKNTASSRWWQAFNTRYNVYYNGKLAYIDGALEKEKSHKDNFTEMLPLYTVSKRSSRELGKGSFERAIEKCKKAIRLHSIKKRPEWTKKRRKTQRDIEWLERKEYNPFLWKAWLLMGRSQFHKGSFDEAAATFSYMSRLYKTQPALYGRARAWLAKCYIEQGWRYDAEDVIRNMQRDSIHWRAQKEWNYALADYYIHITDYPQAVFYLQRVIKQELRKKHKAREWYLMGQLQEALGHKTEAFKAYRRVLRLSPPYELEFNARIAMTEVMAASQSAKTIGRLRRMASSDKNKDYKDRIYYALGNVYLLQKDTARAVNAYERGRKESTRNGVEKGVLLLRLGDIYWQQERYASAKECYGEAVGQLDKEREDYEQLSMRSKILDELVPHTNEVALQDSLQALTKMPEAARFAAIDRVITALKKKEREERNEQQTEYARRMQRENSGFQPERTNNYIPQNVPDNSNLWYFYNPLVVNQGKTTFQRLWGRRENTDDWQRSNKTVVGFAQHHTAQEEDVPQDTVAADTLLQAQALNVEKEENDPHSRAYYLAQLPFTPEQLEESNAKIVEGLYNSAVIFKDKLDNLRLSEKAFLRLLSQYPDNQHLPNIYYHLFLLYSREKESERAARYVELLKAKYPEHELTRILTDPYFAENARLGVQLEDSLYAATYTAFKANRTQTVLQNLSLSAQRFPLGANRDKFIFIGGLAKLEQGNAQACIEDMQTLLTEYPKSKLSALAGMIVNGVKAGRKLQGGRFDMADVWTKRSVMLNDSDSIARRRFTADTNADFLLMLVYPPASVDRNRLLYALARYNFMSYPVRNFDIATENVAGMERMVVSGFRNYEEALQYTRRFTATQKEITALLKGGKMFVISKHNAELLGTQLSYDAYEQFYQQHFDAAKASVSSLLTEPEEITVRPSSQQESKAAGTSASTDEASETFLPLAPEQHSQASGTVIPLEETPASTSSVPIDTRSTTVVIDEGEKPQAQGSTVIPLPSEKPATPTPATPKTSPSPVKKSAAKPLPTPKPAATPAPKPQPSTSTGVYFGDGFGMSTQGTPVPATSSKEEKKAKRFDLEDDYYELEGF